MEGTTVAIKPHSTAKLQQIAKKIPLRKEEELRGGEVNKGVKVTQQGGVKYNVLTSQNAVIFPVQSFFCFFRKYQ